MRILRALVYLSVMALCNFGGVAQAAKLVPYSNGEKIVYAVTWFGATAGTLDFEVLPPSSENGKATTELSVKARTDFFFSLFYKFKNLYRSTVDASTGYPIRFVIHYDESKYGGTVSQEFDHVKKELLHKDRREDRKDRRNLARDFTRRIRKGTQDIVSAFYFIRTVPLAKGKTFDLPIFIGEELLQLRVDVVGEETLSTKIGEVPAWILKPMLFKDGGIKEIPETFLWVAKAKPHAMIKLKAKVKIGSVVAYLKTFEPSASGAGMAASE